MMCTATSDSVLYIQVLPARLSDDSGRDTAMVNEFLVPCIASDCQHGGTKEFMQLPNLFADICTSRQICGSRLDVSPSGLLADPCDYAVAEWCRYRTPYLEACGIDNL
jgi:hypothetical protein